mmetsp:Transcript_3009/g.5283  ORF Transcript_3009/g.5283 Transcript_3009/m.5283 type:complete len:132 (-) Transcript_3009:239-634(-)
MLILRRSNDPSRWSYPNNRPAMAALLQASVHQSATSRRQAAVNQRQSVANRRHFGAPDRLPPPPTLRKHAIQALSDFESILHQTRVSVILLRTGLAQGKSEGSLKALASIRARGEDEGGCRKWFLCGQGVG